MKFRPCCSRDKFSWTTSSSAVVPTQNRLSTQDPAEDGAVGIASRATARASE
jgi:hypothetical protein